MKSVDDDLQKCGHLGSNYSSSFHTTLEVNHPMFIDMTAASIPSQSQPPVKGKIKKRRAGDTETDDSKRKIPNGMTKYSRFYFKFLVGEPCESKSCEYHLCLNAPMVEAVPVKEWQSFRKWVSNMNSHVCFTPEALKTKQFNPTADELSFLRSLLTSRSLSVSATI